MLLAIDIGNTNIVSGIYKEGKLIATFRLGTKREQTQDEYGLYYHMALDMHKIDKKEITAIIIASVVPPLMHTIPAMCERYFGVEPLIVDYTTDIGLVNGYSIPSEVGADRLVNAVAGYNKYGGPLILVDIGTAVTFDVISKDGVYLGGAIAPGIGIAAEALFMRASKLPKIELIKPNHAIGKNTVESMQSGMVIGYIGLVDRLLSDIMGELGTTPETTTSVATGGYSALISQESRYIQKIDTNMTLEGLHLIYERNKR